MERHQPNPEQQPSDVRQRLRAELIERLPITPERPSELAIRTMGAIMTSILEAHQSGQPLEAEDARIIAELLSFAVETPTSALAAYGHQSDIDYEALRREYRDLAARPSLYPETREALNWLANRVLGEQYPTLSPAVPDRPADGWEHPIMYREALGLTLSLHISGSPSRAEQLQIAERAERLALLHGIPAIAFLRLPGVDARNDDLPAEFTRRYVNSYPDVTGMIDALVHAYDVQADTGKRTRVHLQELDDIARRELLHTAGTLWDVVEVAGQVHTFKTGPKEHP